MSVFLYLLVYLWLNFRILLSVVKIREELEFLDIVGRFIKWLGYVENRW